jgi:hypothetical protein
LTGISLTVSPLLAKDDGGHRSFSAGKHIILRSETMKNAFCGLPAHPRGNALCALLILAILSLLTIPARAQVVVDTHGFESPFFNASFGGNGKLEGQPSTPSGTWVRTGGPQVGTAKVQTAVKLSGSQALRIDRGANSDDNWAVVVSGQPVAQYLSMEWDMRVEQTAGSQGTFGPLLGCAAYDGTTSIGLLGSLGVDATTGDVLYQQQTTGFLVPTGVLAGFGAWHHYGVELNYSTHQYTVYYDDVPIGSDGFVDQFNVAGGLNHFTDGDIFATAAAGDPASLALTGTAYMDNFIVHNGQVPEPASIWGMIAMSTISQLRRRNMN